MCLVVTSPLYSCGRVRLVVTGPLVAGSNVICRGTPGRGDGLAGGLQAAVAWGRAGPLGD